MAKNRELIKRERFKLQYRGVECLNCGHPLDVSDKYCPNCSQANSTKKMALKDFVDEFLNSLFNYDSRLLTTFYTMLVKPGTITKDYIRGKRISYTNPFRFLLSLAFVYFLLFTYGNNLSELDKLNLDEKIQNEKGFNFSLNSSEIKIDSIGGNKNIVVPLGQIDSLAKEDPELSKNLKKLDTLGGFIKEGIEKERISDSLMLADPKVFYAQMKANGEDSFTEKMEFFINLIRNDSITDLADAKEKFEVDDNLHTKMAFNASRSVLRALAQPGSWINNTLSKIPFVVFFFLPVFAIFIWVVYIRKNYTYTDHLIFSFHNQSLLFILLIISLIVDYIFGTASAGLFILIFAFYLYKAMRKFYGQNRFKTIVKYIFLNTVFAILAFLTATLLFTGSVFTY